MHTLRKLEDEIYAKNVQQDNTFGQEIQIMKAEVCLRICLHVLTTINVLCVLLLGE